jgi:hypothetical protein
MPLCVRCDARLKGVKPTEVYGENVPYILDQNLSANQDVWPITTFLDHVCDLCLGMCQLTDSLSFMKHIIQRIHKEAHQDVKQVAVSLSISPSFYIWERFQCLQQHVTYDQWKDIHDIKEIIKQAWKDALQRQLGWTYSSQVRV